MIYGVSITLNRTNSSKNPRVFQTFVFRVKPRTQIGIINVFASVRALLAFCYPDKNAAKHQE
jgi:hypothetical protein